MRAARLLAAVALVAAALPARAFRREEASDSSGNVIPGRCLWWASPTVTFRVNASKANAAGCASQDAALALARTSFATWGAAAFPGQPACTNLSFADGGPTGNQIAGYVQGGANENLVVWRRGLCSAVVPPGDACLATPGACADQYGCWEYRAGTIGLTTTTYVSSTGQIVDADMELFDRDEATGTGFWLTCPAPAPFCGGTPANPTKPNGACVSMDLGSTITHEAGHMLGLGHSPSTIATMYAGQALAETNKRVLTVDDVGGVCTIYPAGAAPSPSGGNGESGNPGTECAPLSTQTKKSGGGCSTGGPAGAAALLALAALARLRLRRR